MKRLALIGAAAALAAATAGFFAVTRVRSTVQGQRLPPSLQAEIEASTIGHQDLLRVITAETPEPKSYDPAHPLTLRQGNMGPERAMVTKAARLVMHLGTEVDWKPEDVFLPSDRWIVWNAAWKEMLAQLADISRQRTAMLSEWKKSHKERPTPPPGWAGITSVSEPEKGRPQKVVWSPPPDQLPAWYHLAVQAEQVERALVLELYADILRTGAIRKQEVR